jgi:hypothetical protein
MTITNFRHLFPDPCPQGRTSETDVTRGSLVAQNM